MKTSDIDSWRRPQTVHEAIPVTELESAKNGVLAREYMNHGNEANEAKFVVSRSSTWHSNNSSPATCHMYVKGIFLLLELFKKICGYCTQDHQLPAALVYPCYELL